MAWLGPFSAVFRRINGVTGIACFVSFYLYNVGPTAFLSLSVSTTHDPPPDSLPRLSAIVDCATDYNSSQVQQTINHEGSETTPNRMP